MYIIYEHVSPSGKRYIGQTCQKATRRWRNGAGYDRNPYFYRAIQKYGWRNFEHNIICTCDSLEEANQIEAKLIAEFQTTDPRHGYNISGGSDGRDHTSKSTRAKMSEIMKGRFSGEANPNFGRKHSAEELAIMSAKSREYYKTHKSPRLGKKASAESRKRMSESRRSSEKAKASIQRLNASKAKRVLCVETGDIYNSAKEAGRRTGYSQGNISACCRGECERAYGFHWVYL